VAELAADYEGRAVVAKLNVDTATTTAAKYAIEGIPTMIVFRGGQEVSRLVGARSKPEMAALLDSALAQ
jgi:thioredoxin 1